MHGVIRLLRPHQYIKNGFVFLGVIFAGARMAPMRWVEALILFAAFCLAASCVYVINDLVDSQLDRQHPRKRLRPIASGEVGIGQARVLIVVLLLGAISLGLVVGHRAAGFVVFYIVLNLAYSLKLKHVVIVDVFVIATGFMLRILAGTLGLAIAPSQWLLLTGLMLTLFLGFAKRRAELLILEDAGVAESAAVRRVLDEYSPVMLDQLTGITAACAILSYGLYTVSADTVRLHGSYNLFATVPFVVFGMFRYIYLLHHQGRGSDTAHDLFADRQLLLAGIGWVCMTLWALA